MASKQNKPKVDFIIHDLASAAIFPKPYQGKGTRVGWEVEEKAGVSIASKSGKIAWIGNADKLSTSVVIEPKCRFFNGAGLIAVPGFVDSHTHLVYAGDRSNEFEMRVMGSSYLEILEAGGGILKTVNAIRRLSEDDLFAEASERLKSFIKCGTTTIEIKSGYGLDLKNELKILRVIHRLKESFPIRIISTFMGAHAIPSEFKSNPDKYVSEICLNWIPKIAEQKLAEFNDVFTENKAFTVAQSRRILRAGIRHGLKPKIHADEIAVIGGVDLAVELNAISADHLLKTGSEGIAKLKGSGVIPTLLPGTSTYLMEMSHAPAREMIEAGLPVAIASDHNPGSCQFIDAGLIQSLAMLQLRMSAQEALIAGTLHAAHALGLGETIGAIEVGRQMDLALFDLPSFKHIAYRAGQNHIHSVIAKGKPVFSREDRTLFPQQNKKRS